jgi:hypothetical protein
MGDIMKARLLIILVAFFSLIPRGARSTELSANMMLGYNGGPGFRVGGMASEFAKGFPLSIDLAVGYTRMDPGDPLRARRIFINNNTNGTPEESGLTWDVRMDFLYKTSFSSIQNLYLLAGIRRSMFIGDFKYVGGNEDFEVTSNQWGLGLGARTTFPITRNLGLVVTAGVDYYFKSTLSGHDTEYTPENENVNAKEDYTFSDADSAIRQPGLSPVGMIGISVGF